MGINRQLQQFQRAYQDDVLQTKVLGASPVELIVLLYEGAIEALEQAQKAIGDGNIPLKGKMVNKASDIIEGLRAALDFERGGDLSPRLNELYVFANQQISLGHITNDASVLQQVIDLLRELLSGWQQLARDESARRGQGIPHA
ncbi:flagellar export chaperone FliS [Pseudogulbenkiania subflava]|uniref:Flagellar secretion chaperone FliS n=1 Tax=Pseudogulbenkiania subflava DSM 22618 TaxID=1123014 RepID=A0A1Y6C172_9NEIS|nr:flagellar export chaperone FliS [Pseudogulbenkiania subflava]SMF40173.1 flagellar protein FliS [Pseudogulbenkiania subflava DSM 22618]